MPTDKYLHCYQFDLSIHSCLSSQKYLHLRDGPAYIVFVFPPLSGALEKSLSFGVSNTLAPTALLL